MLSGRIANARRLALLTLLAPTAAGQEIIFFEDFENGLAAWDVIGQWRTVAEADSCGLPAAPFPSSDQAAKYGELNGCFFTGEVDSSWLEMRDPVRLPEWAETITLRFQSWEQAECDQCGWDWRFVWALVDDGNGETTEFLVEGTVQNEWYELTADLSQFRGMDLRLRFDFDPVDFWANDFLGWYVDDVTIEARGCIDPTNYCQTSPNSFGAGATIAPRGIPSIAENFFKVVANDAVPGQVGLFYYGGAAQQVSFGDGFRCVGSGGRGTYRLTPPAPIDGVGFAHHLVDFTIPPAGSGPGKIDPGSTWYFQFWYRDPMGAGSGFNLTDGLEVTFCP